VGDNDTGSAVAVPGWNRCSCTEANLFNVTKVPVSFLQRFHAPSKRSEDIFKNSAINEEDDPSVLPPSLALKLVSKAG